VRWPSREIVNQIRLTRSQRGVDGQIHWNMKSLMRNNTFDEVLEREVYQQPALLPLSPWLGRTRPSKPKVTVAPAMAGSQLEIRWAPDGSGKSCLWVIQARTHGEWKEEILPAVRSTCLWNGAQPEVVAISAVGRTGELSDPCVIQVRSGAK